MTRLAALLAAALAAAPCAAQPVNLAEKAAPGDRAKLTIELALTGELLFDADGKKDAVRLEAKARHAFHERVVAVADGLPAVTARLYAEAAASAVVAGERSDRTLPADRRLVVARRNPDGLLCSAPAGPLTRDELDLVTEHFNPQCLPGLLPGKEVAVGDTWPISDAATQAACLFDAVTKAGLVGKLTGVKDGQATFAVEGTAEGVEDGAKVGMKVAATGTFDLATGRVTGLTWKQTDDRGQGPVTPASRVEAAVTVRREFPPDAPKELADDAAAKLPAVTDLRHADPKGRYALTHSRAWHVTGQTDAHLVLRLVDRGEFVAQATVGVWKKAAAGGHSSADDFKKAVADTPGWVSGKVLADGELPAGPGRWLYRVSAEGKLDGVPVVQTVYLLAGPGGDQVAVTVSVPPEKAKAVGGRDLDLVKAIEFGKR
ncbi:MAG: hypothetical protein C0501_03350 [Isosphaera sp.]|nr:hypothetical protein [Isosphaera sp.]